MNITYTDEQLKEVCHDINVATRIYGRQLARKLHRKVAMLDAGKNLSAFMRFDNNAHWLEGNRHWEFSIPLALGYSLLLTPLHKDSRAPQDHEAMLALRIEDYHK